MSGQKNSWFIWHLFKSFPDRFVIYGVPIKFPIESPMVSSTILNSPGSRVQDRPYQGYLYPPKNQLYIQVLMTWYDRVKASTFSGKEIYSSFISTSALRKTKKNSCTSEVDICVNVWQFLKVAPFARICSADITRSSALSQYFPHAGRNS